MSTKNYMDKKQVCACAIGLESLTRRPPEYMRAQSLHVFTHNLSILRTFSRMCARTAQKCADERGRVDGWSFRIIKPNHYHVSGLLSEQRLDH
jgi:hypothetical protein